MGYLKAKGLIVTLNLHDASGVNSWDAMFPELMKQVGGDPSSKKVRQQQHRKERWAFLL